MNVAYVSPPSTTSHLYTRHPGEAEEMVRSWLRQTLREHNISTHSWGTANHKTFQHLANEILAQEATLAEIDGRLYRVASVLRIDVRYTCPRAGKSYQLYEAEQRFADGRSRIRDSEFAVWEKLKQGEDPSKGLARALKEELGIGGKEGDIENHLWTIPGAVQKLHRPPVDFPGLPCQLTTFDFTVCIPPALHQREYQERQRDKTTIFRWRLAEKPIVSVHARGSIK